MTPAALENAIVWLADDDEAVREGIEALLDVAGVRVRSFSGAEALLAALPQVGGCAVLLVDACMPGLDGLGLLERLKARASHPPVVLMSAYGTVPMVTKAMRLGVADFLEKPFTREELFTALGRALGAAEGKAGCGGEAPAWLTALSPREREVLGYMVRGEPNKIIARDLGISVRTVEVHRSRILHKTGVRNLAELIHIAARYLPNA